MSQLPEHLAALDIGNSVTRALVAEIPAVYPDDESRLRFLGWAEAETQGWHKGSIADLGLVTSTIRKVVEQAQVAAGAEMESAVVGMGGPHLGGMASRAVIVLGSRPREVRREDVAHVMEDARNIPLSPDREILHIVPREFVLDGQAGVRDPVGMVGTRLEVSVHFVTNSAAHSQNLVTAANRAGILVETLVSEAFACGEALPTPEEYELGVSVVLVGGPSSELAVYTQGSLAMSRSIPVGGDHFTGDLAMGLHTARSDAETIKRNFGTVSPGWSHDGSSFEIPGLGHQSSRLIPQQALRQILEPRAQELFGMLAAELRRASFANQLGAGVILAGGGARLQGFCDMAEKVLDLPARIGLPPRIQGLPEALDSPEYATLLSLLDYGLRVRRQRTARERGSSSRLRDLFAWAK